MVDQARKEQGTAVEWLLTGIMQRYGYMVETHQSNRDKSDIQQAAMAYLPDDDRYAGSRIIQPDLSCWQHGHALLVEVKSKRRTAHGQYGLDRMRFHTLKTYQQFVGGDTMYVIYDMDLAGGKLDDENAFLVATINELDETKEAAGNFYFWSPSDFEPLIPYLEVLEWQPTAEQPMRPAWHFGDDEDEPAGAGESDPLGIDPILRSIMMKRGGYFAELARQSSPTITQPLQMGL
jgi:hypothetical protein